MHAAFSKRGRRGRDCDSPASGTAGTQIHCTCTALGHPLALLTHHHLRYFTIGNKSTTVSTVLEFTIHKQTALPHATGGALARYGTRVDTRHYSTIARPCPAVDFTSRINVKVVALHSSTGAALLAVVGLEDEAQRPRVGQGRTKQELAAGAQGHRLAARELAAADRGTEGAARVGYAPAAGARVVL